MVCIAVSSIEKLLRFEGLTTMLFLQFCVHLNPQYAIKFKGKMMEATKVGIREFRAGMAEFIASSTPVAVTRHGQTIGYFIPTHGQAEADVAALKKASKTLDRLLAAKSIDVDAVVAEFKTTRKRASTPKKPVPAVA
jgi:hypothetical protein